MDGAAIMSGDDEDRLDFGEDEELEDQISLGDADEGMARGHENSEQQHQDVNMTADEGADCGSHAHQAAANSESTESDEPPLPPGWVTRVSRQGELYYFHEATTESQWDRPTAPSAVNVESVDKASKDAESMSTAPAASTSQGMSYTHITEREQKKILDAFLNRPLTHLFPPFNLRSCYISFPAGILTSSETRLLTS